MADRNNWAWQDPKTAKEDPIVDWLSTVAQQKEDGSRPDVDRVAPDVWQPSIVFFPPLKAIDQTRQSFLDTLGSMFSNIEALDGLLAVNEHDFFYWAYSAIHFSADISELVLFERKIRPTDSSDENETAVSRFATDLLNAFTPSKKVSPAFRAIGPAISTRGGVQMGIPFGDAFKATNAMLGENVERLTVFAPRTDTQFHSTDEKPKSPMVISAVIDHAIPYANAQFSDGETSSRILGHWQQGKPSSHASGSPASVSGKPVIGETNDRSDIDKILVDQIKSSGLSAPTGKPRPNLSPHHQHGDNPLGLSSTHGGMILDLAAGKNPEIGSKVPWNILAVDLPPQIVRETNGAQIDLYVKSALNWIFFKTLELRGSGQDPYVILTYAFGGYSGRRDGKNMIDEDFQQRLDRDEFVAICVAAGNGYLEDVHANLAHSEITEEAPLELAVPPDSAAPTFIQVWFEIDAENKDLPFQLFFGPPNTPLAVPTLGVDQSTDLFCAKDGQPSARVYFVIDAPPDVVNNTTPEVLNEVGSTTVQNSEEKLGRLVLAIAPSAVNSNAPVGRWTLRLEGNGAGELPAWIERSDSVSGFPNDRRQAKFEHVTHQTICDNGRLNEDLAVNKVIRRAGTLNDAANAEDIIVVAAYRGAGEKRRPAPYSSAGAGKNSRNPDISTIAEFSDARRNRLAVGTTSSTKYGLNGTSAAAAIAAREAAQFVIQELHQDVSPSKEAVKNHLITSANGANLTAEGCGQNAGPNRVGKGVLEFQKILSVDRAEN